MSEIINNSQERKAKLKELILKLHAGESQEDVKQQLSDSLKQIPYGEVVEVEQELISEGLPEEEVLKLCDAHSAVLQCKISQAGAQQVPEGHPIDVMIKENAELRIVTAQVALLLEEIEEADSAIISEQVINLRTLFNKLYDVDKHYQRKEYLLFPYLEKVGITGPPKVMWGKHDEIRELLKGSIDSLHTPDLNAEELLALADFLFKPALLGINDMTMKEEEILFPMSLDKLTETNWYEISKLSLEIGYCLYDPPTEWLPEGMEEPDINNAQKSRSYIQLPTGGLSVEELMSILNALPLDITFVDKDDKVKYFSQGAERIFQRNRAILNRDVRNCHPPASAHIVDKIIKDFRSGKQKRAPFWINAGGKFIHIEYFALRNRKGKYLGTLEVSQDISNYRSLEGEKRILSYK